MKLTPPKKIVFNLSLILAIIAVVVRILLYLGIVIPVLPGIIFWIMAVAWLLLFLGVWLKGF